MRGNGVPRVLTSKINLQSREIFGIGSRQNSSRINLETTILTGHNSPMKVSSVELKTRLGHYLHEVEHSGEPIEVCIRGRVVATLFPNGSMEAQTPPGARQALIMNRALERSGMRVEPASHIGSAAKVHPQPAGDGRRDINTVELMRKSRDW